MKPVLVVAHDSGGAEVVSAWVNKHREFRYSFVLGGPALNVFCRKLGQVTTLSESEMEPSIQGASWVLTGTSWASDLEKRAIRAARQRNVRVVSYLDHWTSFAERFELAGERCLPDEIWAGDEHGFSKAREAFPAHPVKLVPNLYFEEMRDQIANATVPKPAGEKLRILYVTEPTSVVARKKFGDAQYWGYTEYEALERYLDFLSGESDAVEQVRLRPHPSEPAGKYAAIIAKYSASLRIEESCSGTLVQDCAWADAIVGCDSMAMVIGVLAAKKVFCCIPKGGPPPSLPYQEIVRLFS